MTNMEKQQKKGQDSKTEVILQTTPQNAFNIKILEFDRKIADLEFLLYQMKRDKAVFIHETNIQIIKEDNENQRILMEHRNEKNIK